MLQKTRFLLFVMVLLVTAVAVPTVCMAVPTVNLGSTSTFAVLAGTTITNTGPTTVSGSAGGDLGLYPGTSFPGLAQVTRSGEVHLADTVASQAKDALVTAYDDAAGRTPVTIIPTELGGTTLTPGVYASTSGTFQITGTLTLNGQGNPDEAFIFLTDSTLVTASDSTVSLISDARPCRIFWKVGSSATLGTNSDFVGHIFALTSISAQTGASIRGQLLARNGAVTLDTNTIINSICVIGPGIHVTKTASPAALTEGPDSVTYTYLVSNPGTVDLANVSVADDKISDVAFVSGDTNNDGLLQPSEVWVYTAEDNLEATTTNTATASGTGGGTTVSDTTSATVEVSTVEGAELPDTATPWYSLLIAGFALTMVGAFGWWRATKKTHG